MSNLDLAETVPPSPSIAFDKQPALSRQFAGTFAISLLRMVLSAVTGVVLARMLGPVARGEYALILLWTCTLGVFTIVGSNEAVAYYLAARPNYRRSYLAGGIRVIGRLLAVGLPICIVADYFLLRHLNPATRLGGVIVALLCIPLAAVYSLTQGTLQGVSRFRELNLLMLSNDAVYCILALIAALMILRVGPSVWLAAGAFGGSQLFTMLNCVRVLRRQVQSGAADELSGADVQNELWSYGCSVAPANWLALLGTRVDEMVIAQRLPVHALGIYTVAKTAMVGLNAVPLALTVVLLPRVIAAHASGHVMKLFWRVAATSFAGGLLILAASWFCLPILLPLIFGAVFLDAVKVSQLLVVAALLTGVIELGITTLKGMRQLRSALFCRVVNLASLFLLVVISVQRGGLVGAAQGCVIAAAFGATVVLISVPICARRPHD